MAVFYTITISCQSNQPAKPQRLGNFVQVWWGGLWGLGTGGV